MRLSRKFQLFLFVSTFVILFFPVIIIEQGRSDDLSMFVFYKTGLESRFFNTHYAWGRPVLGFYLVSLFTWAKSIAALSWLRLLGVIFAGVFASEVFSLFRQKKDVLESLAYTAVITLTPAFVVFMSWATCSGHSIPAFLSLIGGAITCKALDLL